MERNEGTPLPQGAVRPWWLTPPVILGVLLICVGGYVWEYFNPTETVRLDLTIDLNQGMTDQFVLRGGGCDLSSYQVEVFADDANGDRLGGFKLTNGREVDGVFCRFLIRGEVEKRDQYAFKPYTFIGDPNIVSKKFRHDDTVTVNESGEEVVVAEMRWYHPRDGD